MEKKGSKSLKELVFEGATLLLNNWSSLNLAIESGLSTKNNKISAALKSEAVSEEEKQISSLMEERVKDEDQLRRDEIIKELATTVLEYDVDIYEIESVLSEFMETNFNVVFE